MKKLTTVLFCLFLSTASVFAARQVVMVENDHFSPQNFSITVGDTIVWQWVNGAHTTTSTAIPISAIPWMESIDGSHQRYIYVPEKEGSYDYQCDYHYAMGMTGHFNVQSSTGINKPVTN